MNEREKYTHKIAIKFSYNGKAYNGLARQKDDKNTIAEKIVDSLKKLKLYCGDDPVFAGRTDKGVSAKDMVASFLVYKYISKRQKNINDNACILLEKESIDNDESDSESKNENNISTAMQNVSHKINVNTRITEKKNNKFPNYGNMLNSVIPYDIVINDWALVSEDFSARYDCIERHYNYFFTLDSVCNKIENSVNQDDFFINKKERPECENTNSRNFENISMNNDDSKIDTKIINIYEKMKYCCKKLKQLNNFKNFCKRSEEKSAKRNNIELPLTYYNRTLNKIDVEMHQNNLFGTFFILNIKAKSFLHNMVRKIFYVILNYGIRKIDDHKLDDILKQKIDVGTGPSENLMFCCAKYPFEIKWEKSKRKNNNNYHDFKIEFIIEHFKNTKLS